MEKRTRAMLFSGLVWPGLGQWLLGQKKKGALIMVAFIVLVSLLGLRIFLLAFHVMFPEGKFGVNYLQFGPTTVSTIHARAWAENWWLLLLMVGLWLGSIWDAARREKLTPREGNESRS